MAELEFWKIQKGDEKTARRLKASLESLYAHSPTSYEFDLTDHETDFDIGRRYNIHFAVGKDLDNLLGYANCYLSQAGKNIGDISRLNGLDSSKPELKLSDCHGNIVTRETLGQYDGFSAYTGKGKVLNIGTMEVFLRRQGIGSKLMKFIKSQGYELIELEAHQAESAEFYEANGFVDTGIDSQEGRFLVMAWNNWRFA